MVYDLIRVSNCHVSDPNVLIPSNTLVSYITSETIQNNNETMLCTVQLRLNLQPK